MKNKRKGVHLLWLVLHELGHSLGLDHSSNKKAIMYPIHPGSKSTYRLHRDDVIGIQQLYGRFNDPIKVPGLQRIEVTLKIKKRA